MDPKMITDLKPGDGDQPIEIKVMRKWTSYGTKRECCFMFVDKNAAAIQVVADFNDKDYFDSQLKADNCYRITKYICEEAKKFMRSVPHETAIMVGKATRIDRIVDDGFPAYYFYFNFVHYDDLAGRTDNNERLTDYMGKVEHVTDIIRPKGKTIRKIKLEDLSSKIIEATFWDDMAVSINKDAIMRLPSPVIAAVTSMKVTRYIGLQLTATPASHIYINPKIPGADEIAAQFAIRDAESKTLKIEYDKSGNMDSEKQRNRLTLAELLAQDPTRHTIFKGFAGDCLKGFGMIGND